MYSVKETAKRLGISRAKLYAMVAARELTHFKIGGKILFDEAAIAEFLARCRIEVANGIKPTGELRHIRLPS